MGFTWIMGTGRRWVSHLAEAALCPLVSVCDHVISTEGTSWGFSAQPGSLLRAGPGCLVQALALQKNTWLLVLPLGGTVLGLDRG